MKKLDAFISAKKRGDISKYDAYDVHWKIATGLRYGADPYLGTGTTIYVAKNITFQDVYTYFLNHSTFCINMGDFRFREDIDCCLTLFYNPFFVELYHTLKENIDNIPIKKLKVIERHILKELASSRIKDLYDDDLPVVGSEIYFNHCMYDRSKELIALIHAKEAKKQTWNAVKK